MLEVTERDYFDIVNAVREAVGLNCCRKCILKSQGKIGPTLKFLFSLICESFESEKSEEIWLAEKCEFCSF